MSGESIKLVKVEDVAVRSLKERKVRVSAPVHQCNEQVEAARRQAQQEFQNRLAAMQARSAQQAQQSNNLKTQLGAIEKNAQQRIQQQQQQLQNAVQQFPVRQSAPAPVAAAQPANFAQQRQAYNQGATSAQVGYTRLLQEQQQQFNQLVAQERSQRSQDQQQLQQQLGSIAQDQQRKQQLAANFIADVQTLWQQIDRGYAHQQAAPDRLASINRQIELAQSNLQAGMSEAAIASAQQAYLNLTDLRLQLEQQEQASLLVHAASLEQIRSLMAEAKLAQQCEMDVGEGADKETIAIDVNHWTNGRLSQYEQQLQQLESQLAIAIDKLDQAQLQQINQQVQSLAPTLEQIIDQAQLAVFSSQMRAEIADSIVDALSSLGYSLTAPDSDAIYEGDDQRQAYVVKVQNLAGDEVVAVIRPESEFGVNTISVNAFSESIVDETAANQNAQAVFDALEAEGIQGISPLECKSAARAEYRNMQAVKQGRTAQSSNS